MKVVQHNCSQSQRYGDSYGTCVVELEDGDTFQDVIAKYINEPRYVCAIHYSSPIELTEYKRKAGRYVKMNTYQCYCD